MISICPVRVAGIGTVYGLLAMGRYLDSNYIQSLASAASLYHLNVYKTSTAANEADLKKIIPKLNSGEVTPTQYVNSGFISVYTYARDINNNPALIIKVDKPDDIYQAGQNNVKALLLLLLFAGIIFIVTTLLILDRMILAKLFRLKTEVGEITLDGTGSPRVSSAGKDEFSSLAGSINQMIDRTETSQIALKESERRFRELAELMPILIFEADLTGKVTFINDIASKIFEIKREKLIGLNIFDFIAPEDRKKCLANVQAILTGENIKGNEYTAIKGSGNRFPVLTYSTAIKDGSGKVTGLRGTLVDITERMNLEREIQENEQKYRLLVENQTDLVVEVNTRGEFLFVNPAYCRLAGKRKEQLIGTPVIAQIHVGDRESVLRQLENLNQPPYSSYSEHRMTSDKGWRWLAWTHNAVLNDQGKVTTITCSGRDITESKLAKEELEKANIQLKELDKMKDNFLSTVSHELRTPLTSIKSFAEILLTYDEDRTTQKEFLGIINDESDRLTRLINDFLDISKMQAGKMQWKTVELSVADVINSAVTSIRPLIQKEKLELVVNIEPDLPHVMSDRDKLVQVVTNLLSNAIKFTPDGGKLTIRGWSDQVDNQESKWVTVSVTDTGIGIAPEHHHKIFENFGQVGDVLGDRPKGTGLGLPICKKIVENYGGKIWVESALGKGTTLCFSLLGLKKTASVAPEPVARRHEALSAKGKIILVVDDEANIRRFISYELSRRGHQVIEAAGGKEAVDLAKKHHPDLITLDICMPDLNGLDVTALLKNDPDTKNIPILIISVIEDQQQAFKLGVNDYITKPISIEVLLRKVNMLLEGNNKNILVVDDSETLTRSLEADLRIRGFNIQTAETSTQALTALEQNHPDLILLDLKLADMDGNEFIKAIKNKPNTTNIPIIIMTGIEIDGEQVNALTNGAAAYFNKTKGFNRLFEAIEIIVNGKARPLYTTMPVQASNKTPRY